MQRNEVLVHVLAQLIFHPSTNKAHVARKMLGWPLDPCEPRMAAAMLRTALADDTEMEC